AESQRAFPGALAGPGEFRRRVLLRWTAQLRTPSRASRGRLLRLFRLCEKCFPELSSAADPRQRVPRSCRQSNLQDLATGSQRLTAERSGRHLRQLQRESRAHVCGQSLEPVADLPYLRTQSTERNHPLLAALGARNEYRRPSRHEAVEAGTGNPGRGVQTDAYPTAKLRPALHSPDPTSLLL